MTRLQLLLGPRGDGVLDDLVPGRLERLAPLLLVDQRVTAPELELRLVAMDQGAVGRLLGSTRSGEARDEVPLLVAGVVVGQDREQFGLRLLHADHHARRDVAAEAQSEGGGLVRADLGRLDQPGVADDAAHVQGLHDERCDGSDLDQSDGLTEELAGLGMGPQVLQGAVIQVDGLTGCGLVRTFELHYAPP